jgi:hypothetical protein
LKTTGGFFFTNNNKLVYHFVNKCDGRLWPVFRFVIPPHSGQLAGKHIFFGPIRILKGKRSQTGKSINKNAARPKPDGIYDLKWDYKDFLPLALILAQRAFANAESLALAAGLMMCFYLAGIAFAPGVEYLVLAQRALCAAPILARAAALILRRFGSLAWSGAELPTREFNSLPSFSIISLISAARYNAVALIEDKSILIVREV